MLNVWVGLHCLKTDPLVHVYQTCQDTGLQSFITVLTLLPARRLLFNLRIQVLGG